MWRNYRPPAAGGKKMTRSASRGTSANERTSVASRRPPVRALGTAAHSPWSSWARKAATSSRSSAATSGSPSASRISPCPGFMRSSFIGLADYGKAVTHRANDRRNMTGMPTRPLFCLATALVLAALGAPGLAGAAPLHFAAPIFVDQDLAGGEPLVSADPTHGTLIYTSHEGTTHLYAPGLTSSSVLPFLANYRDQVNMWTSKDDGKSWTRVDFNATGFATDPSHNVGFSDPDLTFDARGRIYNTGIDLANDALFSSADGGITWDRGTPECHEGDRPWLAGGKKDEVFLATNTGGGQSTHEIFQSTDGGNTCSSSGIVDQGTSAGGLAYKGNGKMYYVHDKNMIVEPVCFAGCNNGIGVSTWHRGDA